jgi:hypothetical protein
LLCSLPEIHLLTGNYKSAFEVLIESNAGYWLLIIPAEVILAGGFEPSRDYNQNSH